MSTPGPEDSHYTIPPLPTQPRSTTTYIYILSIPGIEIIYEDISDAEDIGIGDGHNCMSKNISDDDMDLVDEKCSENGNNDIHKIDHKNDSSYDGDDEFSSGNETESDEDKESEYEDFKDKHSKDEDSEDEDSEDDDSEDDHND
ncbi:PREDICTED: phosphopantothenoylcysteine decarboxylase subunit VHS3-like, partial [Nicrophorus vespilloides]|uniref:Phosphopantothenoylcysteine decarboxylase subunit VHS3-like n=1 Tax=Nicrophorus vespilloides TaxID=110193 RepID=A0ABM1N112_NICVS